MNIIYIVILLYFIKTIYYNIKHCACVSMSVDCINYKSMNVIVFVMSYCLFPRGFLIDCKGPRCCSSDHPSEASV